MLATAGRSQYAEQLTEPGGAPVASIDQLLQAHRAAVDELLAAAEACGATWTTPRAPGKWSPSQLIEHVARSIDESANDVAGSPSKFPNLPFFLKPLARGLLFNRVLRKGDFPRARTSRSFNPEAGPENPRAARERLYAAVARFEQACRAREAAGGRMNSVVFGPVGVGDYVRFQEIHARHHRAQLPAPNAGAPGSG